jgi:uracil-DNA glycosylase
MTDRQEEEERFRRIFRRAHAGHRGCLADEWLGAPCALRGQPLERPVVWSRRNGPWHRVELLLIGAAPGNAGGKGDGELGAHGTRIPFGGDIAGGNLDVLLAAAGLTRNDVFIVAALNQLPAAGGGEPALAEILAPVGKHPSSLHLLRDTLLAAGPRLLVTLGNVGLRATFAALHGPADRLPSLGRLRRSGLERDRCVAWPEDLRPDAGFRRAWQHAWGDDPLPAVLWLTHPSAQNMSPYAGEQTVFHQRMRAARDALTAAVRTVLGRPLPDPRPPIPATGPIYDLPEWRDLVGPRHAALDALWRQRGI